MPDAAARRILADISARHRDMVLQGAGEEAVSARLWLERAIEQWRTSSAADATSEKVIVATDFEEQVEKSPKKKPATLHQAQMPREAEQVSETILTQVVQDESSVGARSAGQAHGDNAGRAHAGATRQADDDVRASVIEDVMGVDGRTSQRSPHPAGSGVHAGHEDLRTHDHARETSRSERHDGRGDAMRLGPESKTGRLGGISDYHSRLAAREAAMDDLPLTIWLEQAISHRVRSRSTSPAQPPEQAIAASATSAAVPAASASPPQVRGLGVWPALFLGALSTLLLVLIAPWLISGRPLFPIMVSSGSGATVTPAPPVPPSPQAPPTAVSAPASSPGGVNVTTLVNAATHVDDGKTFAPRRRLHHVFWRRRRWSVPVQYQRFHVVGYDDCDCTAVGSARSSQR